MNTEPIFVPLPKDPNAIDIGAIHRAKNLERWRESREREVHPALERWWKEKGRG